MTVRQCSICTAIKVLATVNPYRGLSMAALSFLAVARFTGTCTLVIEGFMAENWQVRCADDAQAGALGALLLGVGALIVVLSVSTFPVPSGAHQRGMHELSGMKKEVSFVFRRRNLTPSISAKQPTSRGSSEWRFAARFRPISNRHVSRNLLERPPRRFLTVQVVPWCDVASPSHSYSLQVDCDD